MKSEQAGAVYGVVISLHALGATVRLEDGTLGAIPGPELESHRTTLVRAMNRRERIALRRGAHLGRHPALYLAEDPAAGSRTSGDAASAADAANAANATRPFMPRLVDAEFERQMAEYLKSTEEWAPNDRPPPAERHLVRKKRRATRFEARGDAT